MKLKISIIIALFFCICFSHAQDINLTELKAPSSPAFTILGVQPTEIARPTTFDAFKVNLFNNFSDDNGFTLPKNLALEFTPYWLFSHKNLTFEKMLDPDSTNVWTNFVRNASVSVATIDIKNQVDSTITGTRMGIGFRTMIFKGVPSKTNKQKLIAALIELNQEQIKILGEYQPMKILADESFVDFNSFINRIPDEMKSYFESLKPLQSSKKEGVMKTLNEKIIPFLKKENQKDLIDSGSKLTDAINASLAAHQDTLNSKAKIIEELIDVDGDNYEGFFLEFASSIVLDFNDDQFGNGKITKWGLWLTPSYRLENEKFEFLGVIRFIKNETLMNSISDNFDIGAKLVFQKDKFSFSGEFIKRFQYTEIMDGSNNLESKNDLKAVLNIEYKLSDNILITYTFGENFDVNTEIDGNVISTVGISYNIGGNAKSIKLF